MPQPRFFYFDLGNVLLNFDHRLAVRRLAQLTDLAETVVHDTIFTSGWQESYERGDVTSDEFADYFRAQNQISLPTGELLAACSEIFELNVAVIPIVAHLRAAGHRLGVLSNTCAAHWQYVATGRYTILNTSFERYILSYEIGSMKPTATIYERAIAAAGVSPAEIFFTDDRPENVDGARQAGIDACLFQGPRQLMHELRERGVRLNL